MGCCAHKDEIILPFSKEAQILSLEVRKKLYCYTNELIDDFEKILLEKINQNKPRSVHEFNKVIQYAIQSVLRIFKQHIASFDPDPITQYEINKYKLFIISKCKSKQGHFSFLNSYYSLAYTYQLQSFLIKKLNNHAINSEECIAEYKKLAKGCFVFESIQDLHEIILLDSSERMQLLEQRTESIRNELKEFRNQLMLAENYVDVVNFNEDIRSTAISFLGVAEESSAEILESQYDEDIEYLENSTVVNAIENEKLKKRLDSKPPMKNNFIN